MIQLTMKRALFFFICAGLFSAGELVFAATPYQTVKVQGRQLMVDFDKNGVYEPFQIRGVGYQPMPIGRHISDWGWPVNYPLSNNIYNDPAILSRDFALLKTMRANTIRIWKANDTERDGRFPNKMTATTLEYARAYGLKVIPGFGMGWAGYASCNGYYMQEDYTDPKVRQVYIENFRKFVKGFANSPDILFWAIGNENNLSLNPRDPVQVQAYYSLVNEMAAQVRDIEGPTYHPVAVVEGGIDFIGKAGYLTRDTDLPYVDIWGSNVYLGKTFGTFFARYKGLSAKPLWISEFGADAFNSPNFNKPDVGAEDQKAQADWDKGLWNQITANRAVTIGGTVMAYSDEWWKPNEWKCEEADQNCREMITNSTATIYWAPRPDVVRYDLYVGTYMDGGNIFRGSVGTSTRKVVSNIPVNGDTVYVKLTYETPDNTISEYFEYKTSAAPGTEFNQVKLRRPGSIQNHFGFGPLDTTCPPDGKLDYYPGVNDRFMHEEWWGIVSIEKDGYNADIVKPRQVYYDLKNRFGVNLPIRSYLKPAGTLPAGTTSVELSLRTDLNATCRFDTVKNRPFDKMLNLFFITGERNHAHTLSGLQPGLSYRYYVRCQDVAGFTNTQDAVITFSVAAP